MSWGYVAVAAATVAAGYMQKESQEEAAKEQEKAAARGEALTREQMATEQARFAQAEQLGAPARQQQAAMVGVLGPEAQQAAVGAFTASPGQQFLRDQQERALLRSASAIGGLGGGNVRTALQQQAFQRAQTDWERQFGRLGALSGAGQQAAAQQAEIGQLGAAQQAQLGQQAAAARASGILGQAQTQQQVVSGLAGLAAQSGALSQQQPQTLEQQLRAEQGGSYLAPNR